MIFHWERDRQKSGKKDKKKMKTTPVDTFDITDQESSYQCEDDARKIRRFRKPYYSGRIFSKDDGRKIDKGGSREEYVA